MMQHKYYWFYMTLFLLVQIPLLTLKLPVEREAWLSDTAYHLNSELTGTMAKDLPWSTTWSTGKGRYFYLFHYIVYKLFGIGLFQGSGLHPSSVRGAIERYFPGGKLPRRNFKLIDRIENQFDWIHDRTANPHSAIEISGHLL